jgi:hypothetical protein
LIDLAKSDIWLEGKRHDQECQRSFNIRIMGNRSKAVHKFCPQLATPIFAKCSGYLLGLTTFPFPIMFGLLLPTLFWLTGPLMVIPEFGVLGLASVGDASRGGGAFCAMRWLSFE